MALIRLNRIPQLSIRTLHLTLYLTIYIRISRLDRDGVNTGFLCTSSGGELDLETFSEHGERVPGPNDGAVVGACCEFSPVRGVEAVGWIGDEDANGCEEARRKYTEDGGAKGVDRLEVLSDACWIGRAD